MTDNSRRSGVLGRVRARLQNVEAFYWVMLATAVVATLLGVLVFSVPPDGSSLSLSIEGWSGEDRFLAFSVEREVKEDAPDWLRSGAGGGEGRIAGEIGRAEEVLEEAAGRAGVLGVLAHNALPSVLGGDATDAFAELFEEPSGGSSAGVGGLALDGHSEVVEKKQPPIDPGRGPRTVSRPANGYWANTYIPGDPSIRLHRARLAEAGKLLLSGVDLQGLDEVASPYQQPFDPPTNAALGVYLQADRQRVAGKTRLLLQVGLQGTVRKAGVRPEMNVAVVLDWRSGLSAKAAASIRALLEALARARDVGDRFTLIAAGVPGGVQVESSDFRHGPLKIALQELVGRRSSASAGVLSLSDAYKRAAESFDSDDPTATLSSNLILVVATGELQEELVERLHRNVPTSVVGVGTAVVLKQLDQLAASGQGTRRLLTEPAEAQALVGRELSAAAAVVARAVRLRIRLAAGVRLIDILGSHPLGEAQVQRVKQTEQAIDRRVARKLGVSADRGDDEEGIQIVVPAFYAGDAHVILLEVVANGPGAIADVTARYKDLVFLRNGISRAQLALPRGNANIRSPLQESVSKNLLAFRLTLGLKQAASQLRGGQTEEAASSLRALASELSARQRQDRDVSRDLALLDTYLKAVRRIAPGRSKQAQLLASSLQVAAYHKTHSRRSEQ